MDGNAFPAPGLLGDSAPMRQLRGDIAKIAPLDVSVLIEGAAGTGKNLVARAIHEASRRKDGPFVAHNCAESASLTGASTFFGHRRGAFDGATEDRAGVFEAADRGTLLLDQIGDLPLSGQAQLLRVVEERLVRRLGETDARPIGVRLLAATERNLEAAVHAGRFREDLLYRIRVVRLRLPSLESRREDIPLLARAFLRRACVAHGRQVHEIEMDVFEYLQTRRWPANIRELNATIEGAALRATGTVLARKDFVLSLPARD